uniref:Uncharacterized protein n=1 Tax=Arundo donax TaxID=35708 RepID=A0A0A9AEV2_ARUDO
MTCIFDITFCISNKLPASINRHIIHALRGQQGLVLNSEVHSPHNKCMTN